MFEALRDTREDIRVFAHDDKYAYKGMIDDTLTDAFLMKISREAYNRLI